MLSPKTFAGFLFIAVLSHATLLAQDGAGAEPEADSKQSQLSMTTQRIVVFKDGYCLVVKEATGTTDADSNIYTNDVPDAAVLGSFWAIPQAGQLNAMVSGWVNSEEKKKVETEATNTIDIVEANIGALCTITVGKETKLSGEILKVLGPTTDVARVLSDNPFDMGSASMALRSSAPPTLVTQPSTNKFLLRTGNGDIVVDANSVQLLTIADMQTSVSREAKQKTRKKQMRFEFEKPNSEVKLAIMYFRPGVRWIPTYRVDVSHLAGDPSAKAESIAAKETVRLSLQGEIINEAEDFMDVPVDIVVGVPNFRFRGVPSPLVLESVLRNTMAQAAPQLMSQMAGNNRLMFNNNYASNGGMSNMPASDVEVTDTINLPKDLTTSSGNDLFVYSLPKMTLRKGDRASIPILSADVPYRNIHTWEVTVKHTESVAANSGSPLAITENTVWRQIELMNTSKIPWTTGAAMIVDGFQPLAQELLTYTPSGSKCRIPVTIAVDVRGRVQDRELNRELDSLRFARNSYAKVSGQITAEMKNHKKEAIDVEVALRFGGKGDKASDGGELRSTHFRADDWVNYRGDPAVNNSTRATWTKKLAAGETFKPEIDYHFFTRH